MIKIIIESDKPEDAAAFVRALGDTRTVTQVGDVKVDRMSDQPGPITLPHLAVGDDVEPDVVTPGVDASPSSTDAGDPFAEASSEPDESDVAALPASVVDARPMIIAVLVAYTNNPGASRAQLFAALADSGVAQNKIRAARELAIEHGLMTVVGSRGPHTVTALGKLFALADLPAADPTATPAAAARTETPSPDAEPPTLDSLKLTLTKLVKAKGADCAREMLEVYGAQNLSGVAEARRGEFMAAMLAKIPDDGASA